MTPVGWHRFRNTRNRRPPRRRRAQYPPPSADEVIKVPAKRSTDPMVADQGRPCHRAFLADWLSVTQTEWHDLINADPGPHFLQCCGASSRCDVPVRRARAEKRSGVLRLRRATPRTAAAARSYGRGGLDDRVRQAACPMCRIAARASFLLCRQVRLRDVHEMVRNPGWLKNSPSVPAAAARYHARRRYLRRTGR